MNIVAFSGSLRKASYNSALLRAAKKLAPEGVNIEIVSIDGLPVFDQDLEASNFPVLAAELREKIKAADGVLLAVPEFNRTPSGPIKNFLDWSSRPESDPLSWDKKPVGILGASSGPRGASFAQYDVRRVLGYFDAKVMGQPEFYLGAAKEKFDENLELTDERTIASLKKFLATFMEFASQNQSH
ncbi:MAG: NAD(P)H dehydrogenase (quinone):NADPH-dependent FMN reductase [Parcubacteria group bacterium Gr01-1014_8]|nr:MAG: NAD(P)H dehydrogenase (quinone):NADPH-dependent FMN reductase [Parcubacteria group bacterium Gr01-1014_8]